MNLERVIAVRTRKTVYRDGDKVIKLFDEGYSKADILKEALNQARMEETDLKVPKILEVTTIDGKWAIVIEYIEGKTLDRLMQENPEKEQEYLEMFLNIQLKVLQTKSPLLTKLKDKMRTKITNSQLDNTTKYELNTRIEATPNHDCVCHGDFNPSNIIIKDDGTAYIIDWSHVTQGNASADVARTFLLFTLSGKTELAERYVEMYCEKTNTAKQYVQKWIPIVAATQLMKNKAEEQEALMKWINVVDYE